VSDARHSRRGERDGARHAVGGRRHQQAVGHHAAEGVADPENALPARDAAYDTQRGRCVVLNIILEGPLIEEPRRTEAPLGAPRTPKLDQPYVVAAGVKSARKAGLAGAVKVEAIRAHAVAEHDGRPMRLPLRRVAVEGNVPAVARPGAVAGIRAAGPLPRKQAIEHGGHSPSVGCAPGVAVERIPAGRVFGGGQRTPPAFYLGRRQRWVCRPQRTDVSAG